MRFVEKLHNPQFEPNRITFGGRAMTAYIYEPYVAPLFGKKRIYLPYAYLEEREYRTDKSKHLAQRHGKI